VRAPAALDANDHNDATSSGITLITELKNPGRIAIGPE
jgi:hypothetical protein